MLKHEFKRIPVTFHLDRLQTEFDKSHADIPGKNKKIWLKFKLIIFHFGGFCEYNLFNIGLTFL